MKTTLLTGVLVMLLAAPSAYPQEKQIMQLQADMIRLSTQMSELHKSVDEKNGVLRGLVEKMADQVNAFAGNMQKIVQAVDTVKTQNDKSATDLRNVLTGIGREVTEVHEGLSSVRSQMNSLSQQVTAMKAAPEALAGPDDLMRTATVDLYATNYDLAISGFREFISKYPNDPRAADAQLHIGEALFNQKKFEPAIIEFDTVLQKYPDSDKKGTALLKKGLAHAELNQVQQAIDVLQSVTKLYPGTIESTTAQSRITQLRRPRQE